MKVKVRVVFLVILIISMALLSGCQKAETAQTQTAQDQGNGAASAAASPRESGDAPNPELDDVSRLTLGTFKLEGSDNAVTPEQAAKLLPLWKLVQNGAVTRDEETNAVIKQIEGQMTEAQLAAIDAMGLTMDDMMTWMQEQGIEMTAIGDGSGDGQGAPEGMPNMTDEEREQMRQRFENMTEEERAAAMEEGGQRPEGASGGAPGGAPDDQGGPQGGQASGDGQPMAGGGPGMGGARTGNMLLEPLITLLTERAAQ
jgi:hypothetical protein